METILITGASGLIGSHLTSLLKDKGYRVIHLSRKAGSRNGIVTFVWDLKKRMIDDDAVKQADHIIHLAGAGIADERWNDARKKEVIDSRTKSSELLFESIKRCNQHLKTFVAASAIGYYGAITNEKIHTETDLPATDFMGTTCKLWEESVDPIAQLGARTVKIRVGIVLAADGGALEKMMAPVRFGVGSPLGTGKQYMPWIHMDDMCGIFIKAIEDKQMHGIYNGVAPQHINNKELMQAIAKVMHRPFFFPNVPSVVLKVIFGEMAEMFLEGSRVSDEKILKAGYLFKHPGLNEALQNLLKQG